MLEMDQILRSNEINFAVLAALPAVLVSIAIFALARQYALYQVCVPPHYDSAYSRQDPHRDVTRKAGVNHIYLTPKKKKTAHFVDVTDKSTQRNVG